VIPKWTHVIAISLLTTGLAARNGSSDRAWSDLAAYRDALAGRHAATQRSRPARPTGAGTAPRQTRRSRRRSTPPERP
jgi:hypothetical protein